jgi:hypothetical protein
MALAMPELAQNIGALAPEVTRILAISFQLQ